MNENNPTWLSLWEGWHGAAVTERGGVPPLTMARLLPWQ